MGREELDLTSEVGARLLKETLEAYWRERGYDPECRIIEIGFQPQTRHIRYDVRSNICNGIPTKKFAAIAKAA